MNQLNQYHSIGKSMPRRDAREKLTGQARFTSDVTMPGMLYAKVLRSPLPHANVKHIDISAAQALPGVHAVLCHHNTIDSTFTTAAGMMELTPGARVVMDRHIFEKTVRYVGDEVAAVAAETEEIAAAALKLIRVEYEPLPFVLLPEEAEKPDSISIHADKLATQPGHNMPEPPTVMQKGDIKEGFAAADEIVELSFDIHPVKQMQMETMGAVAYAEGNGRLTVWSTTQTTHVARGQLAHIFKIPISSIRVMNPPYVGGGFGVRIGLSAKAEIIASALSMAAKKPVKLVYDRTEDMVATDTRHGGRVKVRLGAKKDGTFIALEIGAVLNKGAYCSFCKEIYGTLGVMNTSLYRIPHIYFKGYSIYTNTTPAGAMRGFGNPQGNMAMERAVEMMAERLGVDPLELRRKNAIRKGDEYMLDYPCDSTALAGCMTQGAESIGWEKRASYNAEKGKLRRGLGMAIGTHYSCGTSFIVEYESAYITIHADGSINVAASATDLGQGNNTALPQIAAEALGARFDSVYLTFADTESTPFGYGAHSSRSMYAQGTAVVAAAQDVRTKVLELAASLSGKQAEDLTMVESIIRAKDGSACFPAKIARRDLFSGPGLAGEEVLLDSITLTDLAFYAHSLCIQFIGIGQKPIPNSPPWHCVFADVTVDTETGKVQINKLAACHDVGRVIHPDNMKGQIYGGVVQGIGYALSEELNYDPVSGRQTHTTMHQYMSPTALDIPALDAIMVEEDDPHGPFGAKGAGETSLVCPTSAIVNAVSNALGICCNQVPLTPERVLAMLHSQSQAD